MRAKRDFDLPMKEKYDAFLAKLVGDVDLAN
jgi:hypothetical protein